MTIHIARTYVRSFLIVGALTILFAARWTAAQTDPAPEKPAPAEAKPAETAPPESKPAEPAPAEPKPAEPAPAEAKPAEPKPAEEKPVEPTPEEPKPAESKPAEAEPTEPKPPEPASAEEKPAEPKPEEAAPAEAKPAEAKPEEPVPTEAKPEEPAPAAAKPDEAKPEEPAAAEAEPTEPETTEPDATPEPPSFEQLGDPEIAQRLSLARDQKDEIAELLEERAEALAEAKAATDATAAATQEAKQAMEEKLAAIVEASDKKLAAVLTEVQLGDFLGKPVEKRLRFMFRFQQWAEVLQWFAEQADMSLVLDAPPPGTFNYTDTREYSPKEAIDMLNGVLITKGYTLIRRGRMLMVIDLAEGLPEGLVHQVELDDIDKRGKFEFVTVQFDLDKRSPDAVETAIKPLLSPYHKIVAVSATQQMFVTDKAGIMEAVSKIIEAIPEPTVKPTPSKPESPVVEVYPITKADPESAMTVLQALVPTGTLVLDPNLKQINAHATPSQQSLIKQVLENMESATAEGDQPSVEVYPVGSFLEADTTGSQLLETLQTVAPNAQLSINTDKQTLVAWATSAEHEKIKTVLEKLDVDLGPRETPQLEIHRLTKVDPETTLSLFQTILPDARLAIDAPSRTLIAVAVPTDQEVISSTLKTLQPTEPGPNTPELQFYELTLTMPPDFPDVIQKVAPNSTVALDQSGMRLMVIASPAEHAKVEKTIQNMQKTTFVQGRPKLVFYPVTPSQRRRFDTVWLSLSKELPGVEVVTDGQPGELAIWARPHQHEVIAEIMEELKRDVPEAQRFQLMTYPIKSADPSGLLSMLETLYPETKIVLDAGGERLLVWTSQQEHESIKKSLEELKATGPEATATVEVYRLTKADPTSTLTLLQSLVPDATLSLGAQSESIVAMAMAEDHETIKATLEKLQPAEPDPNAPQLQFYAFEKEPPADLVSILQTRLPKAEITVDAENKRLVVFAKPSDHEAIQSTIEKYQEATPADGEAELVVYPINAADAASVLSMLEQLYPDQQLILDPNTNRLLVWAAEKDQASIKASLDQLAGDSSPQFTRQLEIYRLTKADPDAALALLQTLVPDAQLSLDTNTNNLIALAVPADQQVIKSTLTQLQPAATDPDAPVLRFHPLSREPSENLVSALQGLAPQAQITADAENERLTVVATAADHEMIKGVIEEFEASTPPKEKGTLAVYPVSPAAKRRFESAVSTLAEQLPSVQVLPSAEPGELAIWAKPTEHAQVAELLKELESDVPATEKPQLTAFTLKAAEPAAVSEVLTKLFPDIEVVIDEKTRKVMVWARPADQARISAAVQQIDSGKPGEWEEIFKAYAVPDTDLTVAIEMLQQLLPEVRFTSDPTAGTILAWATKADHGTIAEMLQEMQSGPEVASTAVVYTLEGADVENTTQVVTFLSTAFPNARFAAGAQPGQLVAWANAKDHEQIKTLVEQLAKEPSGELAPKAAVYDLKSVTAASAEQVLQSAVPQAKITIDADSPKRLTVWARASEHETIAAILEEIDVEGDVERSSKAVVYTLEGMDAVGTSYALTFLSGAFPEGRFAQGVEPGQIVAWASAEDHEQIQTLVDQLSQESSSDVSVYTLQSITAASAIEVLQTALPQAKFTADAENPRRLTAWADQQDQEKIKSIIEKIDTESTEDPDAPKLQLYELEEEPPTHLVTILQSVAPDAEITADAENKRLAVLASPDDQDKVKSAIDQFQQASPSKGNRELVVYKIRSADPQSVLTMLQTLYPKQQFVLDTTANRLLVWAPAKDQESIKESLERITGSSGDEQSRFELYPIRSITAADATTLVATLQPLAPDAKLTVATDYKNLIVWATPTDQDVIRQAVERLGHGASPQNTPQLEVYRLTKANPDSTLALLQKLVPEAQLSLDPQTNNLIALAVPGDQQVIKSTLEQLQPGASGPDTPELRFHPLSREPSDDLLSVLEDLVPHAQITSDAENKRLTVVATPSDHEAITKVVEEFEASTPPEERGTLMIYPATPAQQRRFESALSKLSEELPSVQVLPNSEPGELAIWAIPTEHIRVAELLKQLEGDVPVDERPRLAAYALKAAEPAAVSELITRLFPDVDVVIDEKTRKVMVWARLQDQARISEAIEQIDSGKPGEWEETFKAYPLPDADTTVAVQLLQQLLPDVRMSSDPTAGTILAWGTKKDHETIAKMLEEIQAAPGKDSTAVVYTLEGADATNISYIVTFLGTSYPNARFAPGAQPGQLVAWANSKDHEQIKSLVDQLTQSPDSAPKVAVYNLKSVSATSAQQILQTAVPQAQFTVDSDNPQRLTAWARPSEHETIASIVQEIDVEGDAELSSKAVVYSLEGMTATSTYYAVTFLTSTFPKARFTQGVQPGQVVAWASDKDHEKIKTLVDQMTQESPTDVAVYSMKSITAASASQVLQSAVPDAQLTVDADDPQRLTALASTEDHETIKKILETIDVEGATDSAAKAMIYSLDRMDATAASYAVSFLTTAFPKARFVSGAQPGQVVAWATPKDHAEIKDLIDQMIEEPAPELAPKVGVYDLKFITPASAQQILQSAVPQAQFTVDAENPQRLTAWARPSEHETIGGIVQEIDVESDVESSSKAVVYTLEGMDPSGSAYILPLLTGAFPNAQFSQGVEAGQVVAWASAKDHEQIKALIDQLAQASPETAPTAAVYSLKSITASDAMQFLQTAVPQAQFTPNASDPQRLTAWARPSHQDAIKSILEIIDVESDAESSSKAVIYTIKGMDAGTGLYKLRFLSSAFPKANFTLGAESDQIVAWATAKEHAEIKSLIDQFGEGAESEIVVYSLNNITATNASSVLRTAVPQAEITVDTDNPQRLTAWARQEDHDAIQKILTTIDVEGDEDTAATVVVYKLDGMRSSGAIYAVRFLTTTFPKARFTTGVEPGQIIAWASAKDHEEIKALVDQMTEEPATDVAVYSLKSITAANASQVLQSAVPKAKLTPDTDNPQRLTAVASAEDHEAIKKILETIDVEGDADSAATVVIYTMKGMTARSGYYRLPFLTRAFPKATFTQGAEDDQIVAWATAKDHEKIKSLIDQFDEEAASEIVVYSLKNISATNASTVLQTAVPQAEITVDTDNPQRLTAWARQEDHDTIQKILATIDVEDDVDSSATVVVYALESKTIGSAVYAVRFLTDTFPKARFTLSVAPGKVVAWASAKDHEEIKTLIDKINEEPESEVVVYSLKNISADNAATVLQTAVPEAKLTVDTEDPQRLTAFAAQPEHQKIKTILEKIDVESDAAFAAKVVMYTLEGMDETTAVAAQEFLTATFPDARFALGAEAGQIVAWAAAKDHEEIKALVDQLNQGPPPEQAPKASVYALKNISAADAMEVLQTAIPQANFTAISDDPQRLTAWARPSEHDTITAILQEIDVEGDAESASKVAIYTLEGMESRSVYYAIRFLMDIFPTARFTQGAKEDQVVAWATAKDQVEIKSLIDQLGKAEATEVVIYTLEGMDTRRSAYTLRFLLTAFPTARFTEGSEPGQLVAWASAKDHEQIKALVDQMNQGPPPDQAQKIAVYTVKNITAQSARQVLSEAVPTADVTVDARDPQRLTAWARPSEHEAIDSILMEIDIEGDAESASRAVIYTLEGMDSRGVLYAIRFLMSAFPEASFTQGAQEDQVVAWAAPTDHKEIANLVEQMGQEAASEIVVYSLKNIAASSASTVLQTAVPQAELTVDTEDPQRLTAFARPSDHESIQEILDKIDVEADAAFAAKVVIYTLEGMDLTAASNALQFLTSTFPKAHFALGAEAGQLVAWAAARDHDDIKTLVDQLNEGLPPEMAPKVGVYALKNISGTEATEILQAAVPEANFTVATDDPKRLTAWARPSDHQKIDEILQEIDVETDAESAARAAIYVLEGMSRTGAIYSVRFLQEAVPDAKFTLGSDLTQMVAWASPKDHETIKELVKQLVEESPDSARTAKVYGLKHATAENAIQTLSSALPEATFNVGADPSQLVAWARPNEHKKIEQIVEQLETKGPPETEPQAIVYTLPKASATEAIRILRETLPQAKLTIGTEPHQLIAWARPADHEIIKQLVDKMGERGPDDLSPKVAVYKVQSGDAENAIEFLQSAVPDAEFSVGSDPRRLIAWATPSDHEVIKKAVDEMTTGADQISTHVYHFRYADPMAAYAVLQTLVPSANIALDQSDRSLVVSAMPEDHAKIQETIDEMDRDDVEGQRPVVQVHRILVGDAENVFASLQQLFQLDTTVQLSLDEQNETVLAVASAAKHERIAEMIKAVADAAQEDDDTTMELYSMKNIDSMAAMDVLDQLLEKQSSKAEVSYDYRSDQLVAIGRPPDHEVIKKTLEQLRTEDLTLEIYELEYVDPMSADMAISQQFRDDYANAPQVDTDPMTEQLFVRASEEQHKQIRDLLIKMGETKLKFLDGRSSRSMRTIRLQGDISEALREIQRLWPTLRDNEIRIVSPDALATPAEKPEIESVPPAKSKASTEKPAEKARPAEQPKKDAASKKRAKKRAGRDKSDARKKADKPKAKEDAPAKTTLRDDSAWGDEWFFVAQVRPDVAAEADTEEPKPPPAGAKKRSGKKPSKPPAPAPEQTTEAKPDEAPSELPPLFVVPGDGSITVVSDDPEALRQFEELLRTLFPGTAEIGRNISIFELKHSNAVEVAERLRELFDSGIGSWRRGALPVAIVPDERLNTLVVQGSRIDRETIEGLVRVMDSDQGDATKPQLVPLRYADADDVAEVIRDVFRSRLTPTTSRSRSSTSSIRQAPGVSVDERTNSLVVLATSPLLEEILELANTMDQTAGENPARQVKIIQLENASATRVEEALQRILNSPSTTTRRSR